MPRQNRSRTKTNSSVSRKNKNQNQEKDARAHKKPPHSDESSDSDANSEEPGSSSSSEEDEESYAAAKTSSSKRKSQPPNRRYKYAKPEDSSSSDDDDEFRFESTKKVGRARSTPSKHKTIESSEEESFKGSSDGDDDQEDSSVEVFSSSKGRKSVALSGSRASKQYKSDTKHSARKKFLDSSSSSEDEQTTPSLQRLKRKTPSPSLRSSPRRQSAEHATLLIHEAAKKINYKDDDVDETVIRRKAAKNEDDDESYHDGEEQDGDDDDDEEEADDVEDDDSEDASEADGEEDGNAKGSSKRVGRVRDNDIGTADDSSDEDDYDKPTYQSPQLSLLDTIEPKSKSQDPFHESSDSEDSDESSFRERRRRSSGPPTVTCCPSTEDSITLDPLPALHLCYFTPDGKTRHCFSLDTLRKAALTSQRPAYKDGKRTFLQPPHFRSVISDDMIDQIASRFGREALDIDGSYYSREKNEMDERFVSSASQVDEDFRQAFNNYVVSTMGSRDLYCCPLCYTVAFNRDTPLGTSEKKSKKKIPIEERYSTEFDDDPISILGSLDKQELVVASTLCFRTAAKTKQHLREDHGVDTRVVQGNSLYERFQIRKQDGLLQRWIRKSCRAQTTLHGFILRYWHQDGNNLEFVHLLELVDIADLHRQADPSDEEKTWEAEEYFAPALEYFDSFRDDANDLWDYISGPYRNTDDMDDFVAEDEEEDDGPTTQDVYREIERQAELEEHDRMIARFENAKSESDDSDETDEKNNASDSEDASDEDEVQVVDDGLSSDDDEDDPWMQSKQNKLAKTLQKRRLSKHSHRTSRTSRASQSPEVIELKRPAVAASNKRKRSSLAILDSDDEE